MVDVSVLITCKDKEPYLDECISSVLRQTKEPKEIIVVHDKCDNPVHHAEVKTVMLPDNLGVHRARGNAFRLSKGALVLFLDGDDILNPDFIERTILTIDAGADIAYPDIYFFGAGGNGLTIMPEQMTALEVFTYGKIPIPVTALMKRAVYEKLGGFKNWEVSEDKDFFLRAMCNGYTFKKAPTLLWYRQLVNSRNAAEESIRTRVAEEIMAQFVLTEKSITFKK